MQGENQPAVYRFKFGRFEIANILDSKVIREGLHSSFGSNQPVDAVHELAHANRIETSRFEHPFIPTIVNTGKQLVLFDTGNGALRREHEQRLGRLPDGHLVERLAQAGYKAEDIDLVVITHCHPDHIGGLTDGGRPTFPNARYVFGKEEFEYWTAQNAAAAVPPFIDSVLPVVEAKRAEIVRSDYEIGDHVRILPTPGHTPGHVAFTFGKGKDDAVFGGDLMHTPLQTLYPELSPKFDVDPKQAAVTRRSFLERYCDTDTLCCTAHFPSPSSGRIKRKGNGFVCEMM